MPCYALSAYASIWHLHEMLAAHTETLLELWLSALLSQLLAMHHPCKSTLDESGGPLHSAQAMDVTSIIIIMMKNLMQSKSW